MASSEGNKFSVIREKVKSLKVFYDKEGIQGVAKRLEWQLNEWKDVCLKIAVTGRSGAGKSSFINALRGITADDIELNPAAVNVVECTSEVHEYKYPGNDKFLLYDLPGLGTPRFKRETYLDDVNFSQYDFFIIIVETRFMDDDLWLAKKIEESEKLFYFVRSKIDSDMQNDKKAHPRTHNAAAKVAEIRKDLEKNLTRFARKEIYLIDNYDPQAYDFGLLTRKMIEDSCGIKQDALALSLACLSKEVIEAKRRSLKRMIPLDAYFAAAFALSINLSLTDSPRTNDYISQRIKFYGEQFGVDTTSLAKTAIICDLSKDKKETVDQMMSSHNKSMSKYLRESIYHFINFIPFVGNVSMFISCCKHLKKCLDDTAERALEVHGILTDNLAKMHVS